MSGEQPGYRVTPGNYRVRLTLGGEARVRPLVVLPDPRSGLSAETARGQAELLQRVYGRIEEIHGSVRKLRATREQVEAVIARTKDHPAADTLAKAGKALVAKIDSVEAQLVNTRNKTFQDVVNFPPGLNAQFLTLAGAIDGSDAPVTGGMRARFADLETAWAPWKQRVDGLLGAELERFNALVRERGVPAVTP